MGGFYLGMDVGASNVRIVLLDEKNRLISETKKTVFKRSDDVKSEVESNICKPIEDFIRHEGFNPKQLRAIGLSTAANFDRKSGKISIWPNNRTWDGFCLRDYLMERLNIPIVIEDDANAAALGEHLAGAGKGRSSFAYITIGTGVGGGLVLNDSLYIGSNGWAAEMGHIRIEGNNILCKCGMTGCLQTLVSGPAILKRYIDMKAHHDCHHNKDIDLKDVVELAYKGDNTAQEVFGQAGVHIGNMLVNIVMLLDIPLIVLGGGVADAGDILLKPVKNTVDMHLGKLKRSVLIKQAQLGTYSGAFGALSLAYRRINNNNNLKIES
jgi:glucokinase